MTTSVLVTGGAGYIGSHMTKMLSEDGYDVIVLDSLERGNAETARFGTLVQADIADRQAVDRIFQQHKIDTVLHFAAFAYVGESVDRPDIYYRNNVVGTLNLLDSMRANQVGRFVFSSTCATYGVPSVLPITEDQLQSPINPYGESKLMIEKILRDYAHAFGIRSIALRYFNAAGCSEDGELGEQHDPETHLIPLVLFEAQRIQAGGDPSATKLMVFGDDFDTPDGTCIRDYIHVSDLCRAHVRAMQRMHNVPDAGAEQFNLGTNNGVSVLEVISKCSEITGVEIPFRMGGRRDGDPPELVSNASKAMQALDWSPQYTDISTSIEHAWRWFSTHRNVDQPSSSSGSGQADATAAESPPRSGAA